MSAGAQDPAARLRAEVKAMRLDWLVAEREARPLAPLPIPGRDLLDRYGRLYTGAVSDVLREHALMDQALPMRIQPLRPEQPCTAGFAFTAKSAPNTQVTGEMTLRSAMLEAMGEGHFVVWDAGGAEDSTAWGGVMTAAAKARGVRGAAIDGGVRDTRQVMDADFPVFCRFRHPNAALGRAMLSHFQVPLRIGAVMVHPGDIVVADMDGVVVVPRALALPMLERCEEILGLEREIFGWIAQGDSVAEISAKGGYF
ncbi:RraA family protein [Falsiroseomonas tokyonensis]|uniref:Putative 4-hydroxy-4-methyl-2-oxoglutarate aldolase n=1 Tax=Falsiroseomonas tokyonensis TaxID=430521 RepID=A0ABV7BMA4_9PROT|nr:RraA family protein [Falsiroseomonas tokyonensis]MBU8536690.1 RraA family protein [Falsiroseomonas tokyonensis]